MIANMLKSHLQRNSSNGQMSARKDHWNYLDKGKIRLMQRTMKMSDIITKMSSSASW